MDYFYFSLKMFLRNKGASGQFTFDIIFSCLQKSMRRGDYELASEMVKEFRDYPNALKKRLIYDCCEDCPNLYMIRDIYNTKSEIDLLYPYVRTICNHVKCREVILGFRVACQDKVVPEDFTMDDDMYMWCRKVFTRLCATDGDTKELIEYFVNKYPILNQLKLKQEWNFINKNRLALYVAIAFFKVPYVTDIDYKKKYGFNKEDSIEFDFKELKLPDYVYDKHVKCSPPEHKGYDFFIDNIVLVPRMPETELEIKGKELYKTTNKASGDFINREALKGVKLCKLNMDPIVELGTNEPTNKTVKRKPVKSTNNKLISNESVFDNSDLKLTDLKLLQTQLITSKYKPRTWFCNDKYVLKGPMKQKDIEPLILSDQLKKLFGLVSVNTRIVKIEGEDYLLMDCLIPVNYDEYVIKNSKLETNVKIYNGDTRVLSSKLINTYEPHIQLEILKNLCFRKIVGSIDCCDRNIIVNLESKVVASIDDPVSLTETAFMFKKPITNKHIKNCYEELVEQFSDELDKFIDSCVEITTKSDSIPDEVKEFILEQCENFEWNF